jgi:hypothetical protein
MYLDRLAHSSRTGGGITPGREPLRARRPRAAAIWRSSSLTECRGARRLRRAPQSPDTPAAGFRRQAPPSVLSYCLIDIRTDRGTSARAARNGHGNAGRHRERLLPASDIPVDLGFYLCAPTATRPRDLLLRRHNASPGRDSLGASRPMLCSGRPPVKARAWPPGRNAGDATGGRRWRPGESPRSPRRGRTRPRRPSSPDRRPGRW